MSFNTLIAFVVGCLLVFLSIVLVTDKPEAFIDIPSVAIVIGGTIAALFISYESKTAKEALKLIFKAFSGHRDSIRSLKYDIGQIVQWSYIVQKNGLQGLENEITDSLRDEEPFLAYGADLVITGYTGNEIRQILDHMLQSQYERGIQGIEALKKMGGDAPAFGMLGTLIGLVIMLGAMSSDPSAIGPGMAMALITTFYGIIASRFVFIPLATKMSIRNDVTLFRNSLQLEGLTLLAERKSPRYIQDKINSFVDYKEQFSIDKDLVNG